MCVEFSLANLITYVHKPHCITIMFKIVKSGHLSNKGSQCFKMSLLNKAPTLAVLVTSEIYLCSAGKGHRSTLGSGRGHAPCIVA